MNRFNRASIAVLFKKEDCKPCKVAQKNLQEVLLENKHLTDYIRVLDIKNHTALRGVYCLEKFPTLLLLSKHGQEIKRTVGGRNLTKELFFTVLDEVRKGRSYDLSS